MESILANKLTVHFGLISSVLAFGIPIFWGLVKKLMDEVQELGFDSDFPLIQQFFAKKITNRVIAFAILYSLIVACVVFLLSYCVYFDEKINIFWSFGGSAFVFFLSVFAIPYYRYARRKSQKETGNELSDFAKLFKHFTYDQVQEFVNSILQEKDLVLLRKYQISSEKFISGLLDFVEKNVGVTAADKVDSEMLRAVNALLSITANSLEKRDLFRFVVGSGIPQKLLKLHFELWQLSYGLLGEDNPAARKTWMSYHEIFENLDILLVKFTEIAIRQSLSFEIFRLMEEHVSGKAPESPIGKTEHYYLDSFPFREIIFQNAEILYEKNVWSFVPKSWLLQKSNIDESATQIVDYVIVQYIHWLFDRLKVSNKFDVKLDRLNLEWIPEVYPRAWAYLITYKFRYFSGGRIEFLIENPPNFGQMSRVFVYTGELSRKQETKDLLRDIDIQVQASVELFQSSRFFRFSKEEIEQALKELSSYQAVGTPEFEERKKFLTDVFTRLLKTVEH